MRTTSANENFKSPGAHLFFEPRDPEGHELVEALVAACAIVAHADGTVAAEERRRVLRAVQALPAPGMTSESVRAAFLRHEIAFAQSPSAARSAALATVRAMQPSTHRVRLVLSACQQVLEADGVGHPAEYEALSDIGKALAAA